MKPHVFFGLIIFIAAMSVVYVPRFKEVTRIVTKSAGAEQVKCFTRQNHLDDQFYLAAYHTDGDGYAWVGHWPTLTVALQAAKLVDCRWTVDPSKGSTDERPACFERQSEDRFYLARMNPDGGYGWVGNWESLTLTLQAADLLHCRMVSDPTNGK